MIAFSKLEGAANDFVFFEGRVPAGAGTLVRRVCDRRLGVGADGVVFLWKEKTTWRWRFFNPDGGEAEVCGNAARCVALWFSKRSPKAKAFRWSGMLGEFHGERVSASEFRVRWPLPASASLPVDDLLLEEVTQGLNDRGLAGFRRMNVGNPHLVLINHGAWNPPDRAASSPQLRAHPSLGPAGSNVTWVSKIRSADGQSVKYEVVTFERGVEAETLACGSGALAAFAALREEAREAGREVPKKVDLHFPGGRLRVEARTLKGEGEVTWLQGPAREVFRGQWPKR